MCIYVSGGHFEQFLKRFFFIKLLIISIFTLKLFLTLTRIILLVYPPNCAEFSWKALYNLKNYFEYKFINL
jgi:hypothetical protein